MASRDVDSVLQIHRILHAGYIFECEDTRILFDPIFENPFSVNCFAFPAVRFDLDEIRKQRFHAVFISHFHDDHCSFDSLNLLDRDTPVYVFCIYDQMLNWLTELGFKNVRRVELDHAITVGPFQIIPRLAQDADVDSIYEIHAAGLKILNVVDSILSTEGFQNLADQAPWDVVLWPFQTMRETAVLSPRFSPPEPASVPEEWARRFQALNPRYIVPSSCQFVHESWSWYNQAMFPITYKMFNQFVAWHTRSTEVLRMDPGISIELGSTDAKIIPGLPWVERLGNESVDYSFDLFMQAPPTSSIAKKFPELSEAEREDVAAFINNDMIRRFSDLEWERAEYFFTAKNWQLAVYDHKGAAEFFYFSIEKCKIVSLPHQPTNIDWSTEVVGFKLYQALKKGESLTSMYVRVNDIDMGADTVASLQSADVMDDPLIRSLFSGQFGSYQQEQLRGLRLSSITNSQIYPI